MHFNVCVRASESVFNIYPCWNNLIFFYFGSHSTDTHVHTCIFMFVYIYVYIFMYVYIYIYTHIFVCLYVYMYLFTNISTCKYTYIHTQGHCLNDLLFRWKTGLLPIDIRAGKRVLQCVAVCCSVLQWVAVCGLLPIDIRAGKHVQITWIFVRMYRALLRTRASHFLKRTPHFKKSRFSIL